MVSSASELRARARGILGGGIFKDGWAYAVLSLVIVDAIIFALSTFIIGAIFSGILMLASTNYFLGRARQTVRHDELGALIEGAKKDLGGAIVLGLLQGVFIFLWSLLFIIPGIVKSISYSMAYYVKCDHPEMTATEAITESRTMMNGYKWKYFCLHLSFLGWQIVGALCLGVGVYWANAYMSTASALFYDELKSVRANEAVIIPTV